MSTEQQDDIILAHWDRLKTVTKRQYGRLNCTDRDDLVSEALSQGIRRNMFTRRVPNKLLNFLLVDAYHKVFKERLLNEVSHKNNEIWPECHSHPYFETEVTLDDFFSTDEQDFLAWYMSDQGWNSVARLSESRYYTDSMPVSVSDSLKFVEKQKRPLFRIPVKNVRILRYKIRTAAQANALLHRKSLDCSEPNLLQERELRYYTDSLPMSLQEEMEFNKNRGSYV